MEKAKLQKKRQRKEAKRNVRRKIVRKNLNTWKSFGKAKQDVVRNNTRRSAVVRVVLANVTKIADLNNDKLNDEIRLRIENHKKAVKDSLLAYDDEITNKALRELNVVLEEANKLMNPEVEVQAGTPDLKT